MVHFQNSREALDAALSAKRARRRVAADEFAAIAAFGQWSGLEKITGVSAEGQVLFGEQVVEFADGCPKVAEFAALELGTRLGLSPDGAFVTLRDAVCAKFRLPCLWQLTMDLELEVWQLRELVAATIDLDADLCGMVDDQLAAQAVGMAPKRLLDWCKALVMEHQPLSFKTADELALERRGVFVDYEGALIAHVRASMAAPEGMVLDAQLNRLAKILQLGGSIESHQVRRSVALGVLATPARALQLLQASLMDEYPTELGQVTTGFQADGDTPCGLAGQYGHACGQVTVDPDRLLPKAELIIHLTDRTALLGEGVGKVEKLGPVLAERIKELVEHHRVVVRPVLNTDTLLPSDAYQVPERMRDAITLRNPTSVFPFSRRSSTGRGVDLDHTIPFDPNGPLGQTCPQNLGPLSRREHRAKTHGGWRVEQLKPGVFLWESPMHYRYLVTQSRTIALDPPPDHVDEQLPPTWTLAA